MENTDCIVVGAGIWGCTVARILAENNFKVLVLEKRNCIGGNAKCDIDPETGIEIHSYGSHIFHTSNEDVWNFVNRFTKFNGYKHLCVARHNGESFFMPFGLALLNKFYNIDLKPGEVAPFLKNEISKENIANPNENFESMAISLIGRPLYEAFIKNYTSKQWGTDPKNLSAEIIKRIPIRHTYDTNYFYDMHQGIPLDGYNKMFENMLSHPNIIVELNTNFLEWKKANNCSGMKIFYTGPIDELFSYKFGPLPWRSLRFDVEKVDVQDWQGTTVVNYVDARPEFTRMHEFKHYHPENKAIMSLNKTIICREYPKTWKLGDEQYYPIDNAASKSLLSEYMMLVDLEHDLEIGGRLGKYKYFDMDKSIADAMAVANRFLGIKV